VSTPSVFSHFKLVWFVALLATGAGIGFWFGREAIHTHVFIVEQSFGGPGEAQLFFDRGNGFNEDDSVRLRFRPSHNPQTLRFDFPPSPVSALRYDPAMASGEIILSNPRLIYKGRRAFDVPLESFVANDQIASLRKSPEPAPHGSLIVTTIEGTQDPFLLLTEIGPVPPADLTGDRRTFGAAVGAVLAGIYYIGALFLRSRLEGRKSSPPADAIAGD
jgi:hypothetical protein